ncbi:uncharacterized protein A4U43_C02F4250 [Asparagus officinalis]|uniref:Homeobox-leucine zipper protein n=1 Tax=Asparagus officinalis TaxID=4686 RepID=A0A5P1FHL5_ASPOF|nr:homeobox-leucine zipper protein ATHB-13-like [Asparagus officinalis]ONK77213.1 uncharacterized protein A4U43_C02F4250 [Asparagus officinalis]
MACNGIPSSFFPQNFMYQLQSQMEESHPLLPIATMPQDFRGILKSPLSFDEMGVEDELSDDCSQAGEKKRRLNLEQVRTLERNFELGNKLEPERKMELARALGLQPRQIAIWFQNRRARWKTKKLEKDYDELRRELEVVKEENDALQEHNKKLKAELLSLKGRGGTEPIINLNKETEGSSSNRSTENSSDINLDISKSPPNPNQAIAYQFLHCPKTENGIAIGQEENFCNIFGVEDQSAFWAWSEQQHFH